MNAPNLIMNTQGSRPEFSFDPQALFHPQPQIHVVKLYDQHQCIIVDNFLRDPQSVVDYAVAQQSHFHYDGDNYFPGVEMGMGRQFAMCLDQYFMLHVRRHLGARRNLGLSCRLSMTTLQPEQLHPLQRLCHRDADVFPEGIGIGAAVLYLFQNSALGGTSFYHPKHDLNTTRQLLQEAQHADSETFSKKINTPPGYLHASNDYFELMNTIPAKWNRAIFYEGDIFHAAQIEKPELLASDPRTGRLTLNAFFKFKKGAGNT